MDELDEMAFDGLNNYFNVLSKLGHKSGVNKLLLLIFLSWFMRKFIKYINEDDYNIIIRVLYCISGDCLIHMPNYETFKDDIIHKNKTSSTYRLMENFKFKNSEGSLFRILN